MTFIDVIKVIGACAAIIGTCYSISNSKRSILRRIDRKEAQIGRIDHQLDLRYGLNRGHSYPLCDLDFKREKLEKQINELKRYL